MKNLIAFLGYVIDSRKLKSLVIVSQCFILALLVGCRAQQGYDQARYDEQTAELMAAHEAEIQQLTARAEAGIYATQYLSSAYEGDAWKVAQWLDCLDARYNMTDEAKALACWVVFNRVDSDQYPDNVESVLWHAVRYKTLCRNPAPLQIHVV